MEKKYNKCDIIIPIYNAYDCVIQCIESVIKNTDFSYAHLILIDDKSPDERIVPLLSNYQKKYKKEITVLFNENNLGFVGTANRGMKYSKNDVLLLNSDTEVPENWLDRIRKCAYSDEMIATVTPLSNNATLASVPKIFTRNDLPDGYSLEKMDELVQSCSMMNYPELPTAHGFCMYIKREALDKVGYFDEENFGKGYGEENDFSFRCFEYGYRNVLCDNVYVLHKESQSFLGDKKDNGAILGKKHPELKAGLDEWCRTRDITKIGNNISIALGVRDSRPNVLFVIHDFSDIERNVGGTTLHILDLIKELRGEYNFHVLAPEGCVYKLHSFYKDTDVISAFYERPMMIEPIGLYNDDYERMIESIVDDYKISFVHIHHMIGHFFNIRNACKKKKIKYMVSLHDMYLKKPVVSMLDERVKKEEVFPVRLEVWQKECELLLKDAIKVVVPSGFAKEAYNEVYKNCKIDVIEHGINLQKNKIEHKLREEKNIAFVGAIFPHKGSELLERLVDCVKKDDKIKIHLFGMTTAQIEKSKVFINHGFYKREDIAKLLEDNKIDLVCIFSLAPETFAYTVDEVVAAGVPVLTFNIGAAGERVKKKNLGWVMKYTDNEKEVLKKIVSILSNKSEYEKVLRKMDRYKIKSVETMSQEYSTIYKREVVSKKLDYDCLKKNMLEADFVKNVLLKCGGKTYYDDYVAVINSRKWKLISKIKIPAGTRKLIKKTYRLLKG